MRVFVRGKRAKKDVVEFSLNLSRNVFDLHQDLKNKTYKHGYYQSFNISDPKPRNIHKAKVRDRLPHHAIYRVLYPYFDQKFIHDSYSCRNLKGTHKALNRVRNFARKASLNNTTTAWVLKWYIRKFFASIGHDILTEMLKDYIPDKDIQWLLSEVVGSFHSTREGVGLPLGNLTSQLLVNIYMNEFDQFVKHKLKVKHYIRYADDFVILSRDKKYLEELIPQMKNFLLSNLKLELHPNKISIRTISSGIDFLGWVHFPDYRVLRTATKRRMMKRIEEHPKREAVQSYLGLLSHGDTNKIRTGIEKQLKLM